MLSLLFTYCCISYLISLVAVEPVGGDISIMAEAALVETGPMTRAEKKMYEHIAKLRLKFPDFKAPGDDQDSQLSSSGRCFYTRLPGLVKRVGMSTAELTALNLDKVCIYVLLFITSSVSFCPLA